MQFEKKKARQASFTTIEFTEDMAKTLYFYFDTYQQDGVAEVLMRDDKSLWLKNPNGSVQFLGSTGRLGTYHA